jgi:hypothetical protein
MTVEDAIYIEALPDVVWAVTVDVERWPEWTPTVTALVRVDDGPFGLGSTARIKQPGQPASEWTVTEFVPGRRFVWATRRPGLRMRASHEVEAADSGTSSVLRVEIEGVMGVLFWPLLRGAVRRALSQENRGLKARCEALTKPEDSR